MHAQYPGSLPCQLNRYFQKKNGKAANGGARTFAAIIVHPVIRIARLQAIGHSLQLYQRRKCFPSTGSYHGRPRFVGCPLIVLADLRRQIYAHLLSPASNWRSPAPHWLQYSQIRAGHARPAARRRSLLINHSDFPTVTQSLAGGSAGHRSY